MKKRNF